MDAMGFWYERSEIAALLDKYGLRAKFVPSNLYPYRFHAVIQKAAVNTESGNQKIKADRIEELRLVKTGRSA
jgi:hypothetical protein